MTVKFLLERRFNWGRSIIDRGCYRQIRGGWAWVVRSEWLSDQMGLRLLCFQISVTFGWTASFSSSSGIALVGGHRSLFLRRSITGTATFTITKSTFFRTAVIRGVVPPFGQELYLSTFSEQHRKVQGGFYSTTALFWHGNFDVRYLISRCLAFSHLGHCDHDCSQVGAVHDYVCRC